MPTEDSEDVVEYEVDEIEGCRLIRGQPMYRVQWTNWSRPWNREPFRNVYIAINAMKRFYTRYPNAPGKNMWETYKANPNDPQFATDDTADSDSDYVEE
jgi:hypothetical protein